VESALAPLGRTIVAPRSATATAAGVVLVADDRFAAGIGERRAAGGIERAVRLDPATTEAVASTIKRRADLAGSRRAIQQPGSGHDRGMEIAVFVLATVSAVVSAVVVIWLFVWAAHKDGDHDRAVQARLGIRRRTRLGR
jgi:hypothetical protein